MIKASESIKPPRARRSPIIGIVCVLFLFLAVGLPLVLNPRIGGRIDMYLFPIVPIVCSFLVAIAIFRREPFIWPILGIALILFDFLVRFAAVG